MRALTIALCLITTPALADVTGPATVIDGDTLEVQGERIRLHGIDAPESRQICRLDGKTWQCGQDAPIHAAMRADALLDKGDLEGCAVFKRVVRAAEELLRKEPGPEEATH